jgi:hypothetical protein
MPWTRATGEPNALPYLEKKYKLLNVFENGKNSPEVEIPANDPQMQVRDCNLDSVQTIKMHSRIIEPFPLFLCE